MKYKTLGRILGTAETAITGIAAYAFYDTAVHAQYSQAFEIITQDNPLELKIFASTYLALESMTALMATTMTLWTIAGARNTVNAIPFYTERQLMIKYSKNPIQRKNIENSLEKAIGRLEKEIKIK